VKGKWIPAVNSKKTGGRVLRKLYVYLAASLTVLQVLAVLCALEQPAYAYVDPGSGLLAFQILGSTFAAGIFLLRRQLRRLFGGKSAKEGKDEPSK
jgi:hypothetical protein